jgi:hypothetical protein
MASGVDLTGKKYGLLVVLRETRSEDIWLCKCSCGRKAKLFRSLLSCGVAKDCGCIEHGHGKGRVHGHLRTTKSGRSLRTKEYQTWLSMKYRCLNPKSISWELYGGRGIKICGRWLELNGKGFLNFLADMGPRPIGKTIDRMDANGNYEPNNCKWATAVEQRHNQRRESEAAAMIPDELEVF